MTQPDVQRNTTCKQNDHDTHGSLLISFLLFTGPLVAGGGLLAIWRTGEQDLFYAAMMPVGIIMWGFGAIMKLRPSRK